MEIHLDMRHSGAMLSWMYFSKLGTLIDDATQRQYVRRVHDRRKHSLRMCACLGGTGVCSVCLSTLKTGTCGPGSCPTASSSPRTSPPSAGSVIPACLTPIIVVNRGFGALNLEFNPNVNPLLFEQLLSLGTRLRLLGGCVANAIGRCRCLRYPFAICEWHRCECSD